MTIDAAALAQWRASGDDDKRNRSLLAWLSDDESRASLFTLINLEDRGCLSFPSRDASPRETRGIDVREALPEALPGHVSVKLITDRTLIEAALCNPLNGDQRRAYSSRIYAELGGGSFMLALDPWATAAHNAQRKAFVACMPAKCYLPELAHVAVQAAAVMALRGDNFDLVQFAEASALRYVQLMMGYASQDYPLLEAALRAGYTGLVYQVFGRHFKTDPTLIPQARTEMGRLLARSSALIDAYQLGDEDELAGCQDEALPKGVTPALKRLGQDGGALNGEQRAVLAVGAAIGTAGNVQAAICIAVKALFASEQACAAATKLSHESDPEKILEHKWVGPWQQILYPALNASPPIPFLPRLEINPDGTKAGEVLLALGGATRKNADNDPLIWGLTGDAAHACAGETLAWPLIIEVVRQVMALPGLAQQIDPLDGQPKGLKKRWGFICESYPLTYRRDVRRAQTSLNVAMRIRSPVQENAAKVRQVIRAGAPRIDQLLRASRQVHFAWFELIENDTVLVLHTVYDGPFGAYLHHFAAQAGDLFDLLFTLLVDPPPMPVRKFQHEFAAHLLRYDRPPAEGYFFSAYPRVEVAQIDRLMVPKP